MFAFIGWVKYRVVYNNNCIVYVLFIHYMSKPRCFKTKLNRLVGQRINPKNQLRFLRNLKRCS